MLHCILDDLGEAGRILRPDHVGARREDPHWRLAGPDQRGKAIDQSVVFFNLGETGNA